MRDHWSFYLVIIVFVGVLSLLLVYPINRILPPIFISLSVILVIYFIDMRTRIDEEGVYIKYFPFHLKGRIWKWSEIESLNATHYEPLTEFGGWGIRRSFNGNKCYSTKGNFAFKIRMNNKDILIGTQRKEDALQITRSVDEMRLTNNKLNKQTKLFANSSAKKLS